MADKLQWWRDNRFGMFVHWGMYAATEGYWNGQETEGIGEWIQNREKIPLAEYRKLAAQMTLSEYDADEWVALAKRAGMGHIVITAKHHEGFAMYDSACSDYNIVQLGPSGRDPLAELSAACQRGGIRFCIYYSHCLDFAHPHAYGNAWDFDPEQIEMERYVEEKLKPQLRELLTNYGPVGLIWFDMPRGLSEAGTQDLRDLVHELQPNCIIGARLGYHLEDYHSLGDNELPCCVLREADWETPATLNDTWGYKRDDQNWKTPAELVESLAELAACDVNYLLNIGPTASGRIPDGSVQALEGLGEWMAVHRESVIGTQGSPFASHGDNWFATQRDDKLYLFQRDWQPQLSLRGLTNDVVKASLPGAPTVELGLRQADGCLHLQLPDAAPTPFTGVIELTLDGRPECAPLPVEQPDGCIYLTSQPDQVEPGSAPPGNAGAEAIATELAEDGRALEIHGGRACNWRRSDDKLCWQFDLETAGRFAVIVRTRGPKYGEWIGGEVLRATIGGQSLEAELQGEEAVNKPRTRYFPERGSSLGTLSLQPGKLTLELSALRFTDGADLSLCEIVLRRKPEDEQRA